MIWTDLQASRTVLVYFCLIHKFFLSSGIRFLCQIFVRQTLQNNRVATAQGKQGIWFSLFPDRENTGNSAVTQGKFWRHRENILVVIINIGNMLLF